MTVYKKLENGDWQCNCGKTSYSRMVIQYHAKKCPANADEQTILEEKFEVDS